MTRTRLFLMAVGLLGGWLYVASLAIPKAYAFGEVSGEAVTGNAIAPSTVTVSGSTVPSCGMYVSAAGVLAFSCNSNPNPLVTFSGVSGTVDVKQGPLRTVVNSASIANVAATMSGHLDINTTAVGNVGASGPDDLIAYTLPASALTGRCLDIHAYGSTANNANAKTVRLQFGATTLVTKALTASVAGSWDIRATVCRTAANAQHFSALAINSHGTTVSGTDGATVALQAAYGTATETEAGAIVIKGQSTVSTADNDVVQRGMTVSLL